MACWPRSLACAVCPICIRSTPPKTMPARSPRAPSPLSHARPNLPSHHRRTWPSVARRSHRRRAPAALARPPLRRRRLTLPRSPLPGRTLATRVAWSASVSIEASNAPARIEPMSAPCVVKCIAPSCSVPMFERTILPHSKFAFLSRCSFARGSRRPLSVIQRFCREPVVLRRHCDCDTITAAVTAKEE